MRITRQVRWHAERLARQQPIEAFCRACRSLEVGRDRARAAARLFGAGGPVIRPCAKLALLSRARNLLEAIKTHTPMIRNNLIMLFSRQHYADLIAPEGKEKLRAEALAEVQKVMQKETGEPVVEEVFFTSFVMQ